MIISELFEAPQQCPECGGISFSNLILAEKKDACYHKVKASAKVWPSAYASGRLVQCRKKGAANYGNKSEGVAEGIEGSVVFSGTGDNGGKYEIIQSGPNDFMIHANGKHIDSYDSLQRAMSVLQNEVPGLTKGVAEGMDPDQQGRLNELIDDYNLSMKERSYWEADSILDKITTEFGKDIADQVDQQGVAEDWKGDLGVQGYAVGGPIGGLVGGAVGELTKEEQLNEFAPLLAAGARLVIAMAPKIAQVLKNTGKATAKAAAPVAKSGAEVAAKNAGQIGVGLGAYEIGSSVADIAKDITAKVGTALEEQTVMELAQVAFKFAIPAGIVLAILYGGKKVIDSLFSNSKTEQGVAEGMPADNDMGSTTGGAKMTLGQWKQMWMKKMPNADFAAMFRSPPNMRGSAIAYFDGWVNNPDARWDPQQGVAEGEQQKGADYRDPKEVDYDDEYDAMVARVQKLAGIGPMQTVYDPAKRQYRNMPTAQQPKK